MSYAVIKTGGKQYKVNAGEILKVEKLQESKPESIVDFKEILAYGDDTNIEIGTPIVKGGKVKAEIVRNAKDKKVIVFKYKNKIRYRKKNGHRQAFTEINIKDILIDKRKTTKRSVANGS